MHAEAFTIRCKITFLKSPVFVKRTASDAPAYNVLEVRSAAVPYTANGEGFFEFTRFSEGREFELGRTFFEPLSDEVLIVGQRPARVCCRASCLQPRLLAETLVMALLC